MPTQRLSGRAPDSRLVHFEVPEGSAVPRPGDIVTVTVTDAKPFFLIADDPTGAPLAIRRTRAGDAWDRAEAASCGVPASGAKNLGSTSSGAMNLGASGKPVVGLGLPTMRVSHDPVGVGAVAKSDIYDPSDGQR